MQYLREFLAGQLQRPLTGVFFSEDWDFGTKRFLNDGAGEIRVQESGDILFRANGTLGNTPTFNVQDMVFAASAPRVGRPAPAPNVFARCGGDLVSGRVGNWTMTEGYGLEGPVADGHAFLQRVAFQQVRRQALPDGLARAYAVFDSDIIPAEFLKLFTKQPIADDELGDCQMLFSFSPENSNSQYALLLQDNQAWVRIQVQQQFDENISWHRDALIDTLSFLWGETVRPLATFTQTSTADITDVPSRRPSMAKNRCFLPPIRVFPNRGRNPLALITKAAEYFFFDGLEIIRHLKGWWSANTCYPEVQAAALILLLENIGRQIDPAIDNVNVVPALAQLCEIELSPSPTEGLMQEVESLDVTRTVSRSIDDQFIVEEMEHLYVVIQFLYKVILSRFGCSGTFAYPNMLVWDIEAEAHQAN